MDVVSLNSEPAFDDDADGYEIEGDCTMTECIGQTGIIQGENPLPPAVGMEFESYEDVYYFYNCFAKDQGFGVRVSNTWYRKSKERYRGKLSCSSAGFKKKTEANRPRPETRTGCPAMIKFRLMENKRWRIIEIELEHNHLISPVSGKFYKSHKTVAGVGTKRPSTEEEVQKIRLFRTVIIERQDLGNNLYTDEGDPEARVDQCNNQLKLKQGDAQAIRNFLCHMQLMNPNFFYVIDLNEKGILRNIFWADTRFRSAYLYFGDVVAIDTTCLTEKYEVPLVIFTGVNHHGQSVLFGCGLLAGDTVESFIWLFRAWLTFTFGRPPQVIISGQNKALQTAIADVFPRASHCFSLTQIMERVSEKFERLYEYEVIKSAFIQAVYHSLRVDEFEAAWQEMIQNHGIRDGMWLQTLYEDRKRWVPVYLKETFLAGMYDEGATSFFDGYLNKHTPLKDFFDKYDPSLKKAYQDEIFADMESSRDSSISLKSRFYFELQLSKLYTNAIFTRFQTEVEGMCACFSTRQISVNGSTITYIVKEHVEIAENTRQTRDFEVIYNTADAEVLCICGLFNSKGYICRHALSILNENGIEEIPPQYILSRWRKDITRNYNTHDYGCNGIDINNPIHRYDRLYKCAVRVVEEGKKSRDRYKFAIQSLNDILNKVRIADDGPV